MPIIPRSNPGDIAQISPLMGVRNDARVQPVTGAADAVIGVAKQVQGLYQQKADQADMAAYMAAQQKMSEWENGWYDPSNPHGVHAYQGTNALHLPGAMLDDYDKTAGEVAQSLPSDRARTKFLQFAAENRAQTQKQLFGYATAQNDAAISDQRKAWVSTQQNDLITAQLTSDDDFKRKWAVTLDTLHADAAAHGDTAPVVQARIEALQSGVHSGVVNNLMARGQALAARDYYAAHADQFLEDDKAKVLRTLQPLVEDEQASEDVARAQAGAGFVTHIPPTRGQPSSQIKTIIEDAAKAHGVPPQYLLALAEQESAFNPKARNKQTLDDGDHAEGLFQYRASTAQALGGFDRTDPVASANAAARQFRERMDAHGPDFAIAAHFAGDGGAEAVVGRGKTVDNPRTARYLEEVKGRAARYAGTAPQAPQAPAESEGDVLARLQTIDDPLRRDRAIAKAKDQFQVRKLQQDENDRQWKQQVYQAVWEAKDPHQPLQAILGPENYAAAARQDMLGGLMDDLKKRQTDAVPVDNPQVVGPYLDMMRRNPRAFAQMDVMRNASQMTPDTRKQLLDAQDQVRKGKADFASESEQLDALLFGPLKLTGETTIAKAGRAPLETAWYAMKREWSKAHGGKEPDAADRDGMLKRLRTSFALNGAKLGDSTPDYASAGLPTEIPAADRQQIVAAMRRAGKTPTEADILKRYLIRVGQ